MGLYIFLIALSFGFVISIPINQSTENEYVNVTNETSNTTGNYTPQNLYVIKAIVYEIGILTNATDDDLNTNDTISNERVDLTFFNPDKNGSIIDLGNIPIPVQTNISGHTFTGIAPIDLGSIMTSGESGNLTDLTIPDKLEKAVSSLPTMYISNMNNISNDTFKIPPLIPDSSLQPISWKSTNSSFFSTKKT